ncbi:hypothetical protein TcBrA4_0024610 [Trypanosoma cruzi]|nr:hypothetical protein TcBrA4_0024610 [Trypanosoma cruzi]
MLGGCPGGSRRRVHRTTNVFRCGEDTTPDLLADIGHRIAPLRKVRCNSCPHFGRPARALRTTSNPLCRWCCSSHTEETDRPDLLRNLHLACPRHLLVERRAAGQRRPAKAAAASSRPSTIWRYTPDALTLALQSLQKASHADSATAPPYSQEVPHAQVTTKNVKRVNEQKKDSATPQAPMTAIALRPLRYGNPHQPLSPRRSTGGPAAHDVG